MRLLFHSFYGSEIQTYHSWHLFSTSHKLAIKILAGVEVSSRTLFQAHWLLLEFSFLHLESLWQLASPTPLGKSLWTQGKPSSVQFSRSVMSSSLRPLGLQHSRLPYPSPTPGACSNSGPLRSWCHPTISSSVIPFSSCLQSFPESGPFPVSHFFTSGGQSIGASAEGLNPF